MRTVFISDLHLSERNPETALHLVNFLQREAGRTDVLYILGDLFDAWIGDDAGHPALDAIKQQLRTATDRGLQIRLMHGNRDFLLGESFCRETGIELISDPTRIELNGTSTLLMHGDTLCTDDVEYQAYRSQVRDPGFIKQFLSQPIQQRLAIANEIREKSGEAKSMKAEDIMDVNQTAVIEIMREYDVRHIIHGHTHRPGVHEFSLDGIDASRYVLGEWRNGSAWVMTVDDDQWGLIEDRAQ